MKNKKFFISRGDGWKWSKRNYWTIVIDNEMLFRSREKAEEVLATIESAKDFECSVQESK